MRVETIGFSSNGQTLCSVMGASESVGWKPIVAEIIGWRGKLFTFVTQTWKGFETSGENKIWLIEVQPISSPRIYSKSYSMLCIRMTTSNLRRSLFIASCYFLMDSIRLLSIWAKIVRLVKSIFPQRFSWFVALSHSHTSADNTSTILILLVQKMRKSKQSRHAYGTQNRPAFLTGKYLITSCHEVRSIRFP